MKTNILIIDDDTSEILCIFINYALVRLDPRMTVSEHLALGGFSEKKVQDLLSTLSKIKHDNGWCNDPNCPVPQNIKEEEKKEKEGN